MHCLSVTVKMRENEENELNAKCHIAREKGEGGKFVGFQSFGVRIICCCVKRCVILDCFNLQGVSQ